jgi:PncC family amidohydrolase
LPELRAACKLRPDVGHDEDASMQDLLARAERIGRLLKDRGETITVAESSTGGLVSAALLAVPGASAYFLGGAIVYTQSARKALLDLADLSALGLRAATEPYARLLAQTARERFTSTWGLAESGATGPTGNRYGDASGHCCLAVAGPVERVLTLETGRSVTASPTCALFRPPRLISWRKRCRARSSLSGRVRREFAPARSESF